MAEKPRVGPTTAEKAAKKPRFGPTTAEKLRVSPTTPKKATEKQRIGQEAEPRPDNGRSPACGRKVTAK